MIITCPECKSKFKIAEDQIKENGRFVRCSNCSHEWVVFPSKQEQQEQQEQQEKPKRVRGKRYVHIAAKTPFFDRGWVLAFSAIILIASMLFMFVSLFIVNHEKLSEHPAFSNIYSSFAIHDTNGLVIENISAQQTEIKSSRMEKDTMELGTCIKPHPPFF